MEIQAYHSIQVRGVNLIIVKKKIIMSNEDVALQVDNIAMVVKYLDLAWDHNNFWNRKVTAVFIILGTLGSVSKSCSLFEYLGNSKKY